MTNLAPILGTKQNLQSQEKKALICIGVCSADLLLVCCWYVVGKKTKENTGPSIFHLQVVSSTEPVK